MHQGVFIRCFTLELKSLGHFVAHPVARVSRYGTLNTGNLTENSPTKVDRVSGSWEVRGCARTLEKCLGSHSSWGVAPRWLWVSNT